MAKPKSSRNVRIATRSGAVKRTWATSSILMVLIAFLPRHNLTIWSTYPKTNSMSKPKKNPQEPRRLKTRAALMLAGAELLAERPIDAIPVNDIVDAAQV